MRPDLSQCVITKVVPANSSFQTSQLAIALEIDSIDGGSHSTGYTHLHTVLLHNYTSRMAQIDVHCYIHDAMAQ